MKYLQFNVTPMDSSNNYSAKIWWYENGAVVTRDIIAPTVEAGWRWIENELVIIEQYEIRK